MASMGALNSYSKGSWALLKLEQVLGLWTKPADELDDREDAVMTLDTGTPPEVELKWGLADLQREK